MHCLFIRSSPHGCLCHSACPGEATSFRHAHAVARAVKEVTGHATVFSEIGVGGRHMSNGERDFHRRAAGATELLRAQPWYVRIPVRVPRTGKVVAKWWPVLLPHILFAAMYREGVFGRLCPPGKLDPGTFWGSVRDEEWAQNHPAYQHDVRYVLPLRLHGDEGTMHGKTPGLVVQWQSLLQHASCWDSRFLVTIIPTRRCVTGNKWNFTWQGIFRALVWSFRCLLAGQEVDGMPDNLRRPRGVEPITSKLAGVWRGCFVGIKGDGKWLKQVFMPERDWSRRFICRDCWASRVLEELIYTDTRPSALWRLTRETNERFLMHAAQNRWSMLLELPGMHRDLIVDDLLHVLYLGMLKDAVGSALRVLTTAGWFAVAEGSVNAALLQAFGRFEDWCRSQGITHNADSGKWTAESIGFGPREYPSLSNKGAAVKLVTAWLAGETSMFARTRPHEMPSQLMAVCFWGMATFMATLDHEPLIMADAARQRAIVAGQTFMLAYMALATLALQRRLPLWKTRPKDHVFDEVLIRMGVSKVNPRFSQCFLDEDFIGKVCKLVRSTHALTAPLRTLQRYLALISCMWFAAPV